MAISLGSTGTADSVDAEYFNWESSDRRFMVHMHLDAIDGLARDAIESSEGSPREIGGLLLGQVGRGDRPVVWIERYQRVEIEHRSGPEYVLAETDHAEFERSARILSENSELTVVGFYRTRLRMGLQLEESDRALVAHYFGDPEDLVLLLQAEQPHRIQARFFGREPNSGGRLEALGPAFAFRGRMIVEPDDPEERTAKTAASPEPPAPHRRLVPDFGPEPPQGPAREAANEAISGAGLIEDDAAGHGFLVKKWPLIAALAVVAAAIALAWQQASHRATPPPARVAETAPARPLGLYVDPTGDTWRVSWNPSATGLQGARTVKLFVRDGDEPSHVFDLTPSDLQAGAYQYTPKSHDVMFRLEITDAGGRVSAESFRLINPATLAPAPATPQAPPAPPSPGDITQARATHRVAPVVPASIKPRLHGSVPVEVRVKIDTRGRVTSAVPVVKPHTNLDIFLATRAVYAAKQWRFEPARQGGHPVPTSQIIHFVFGK